MGTPADVLMLTGPDSWPLRPADIDWLSSPGAQLLPVPAGCVAISALASPDGKAALDPSGSPVDARALLAHFAGPIQGIVLDVNAPELAQALAHESGVPVARREVPAWVSPGPDAPLLEAAWHLHIAIGVSEPDEPPSQTAPARTEARAPAIADEAADLSCGGVTRMEAFSAISKVLASDVSAPYRMVEPYKPRLPGVLDKALNRGFGSIQGPGYVLNLPSRIEVPVLFDSPHSGRSYPADFRHAVDLATLRKCEDEYVDLLYADAPRHGALLLVPSFPRSYIDLNRLPGDIYDLKLLAQEWRDKLLELAKRWPEHLVPTIESQNGIGLIWRVVDATMDPIYDRPVSLEEMLRRLNNYYQPYHGILAEGMDVLHEQFGQAYFVDCHSMLSQGTGATLDSEPRPDFVVSDGEGATSEPGFSQLIVDCLRKKGYRVGYNDPFKGAMMVFMHGCPADGRHAVQIEARKGLYIDEETLELKDEFSKVRADLSELSHEVTEYARRGRAVLV